MNHLKNKEGNPVPQSKVNTEELLEFFESFMDSTCTDINNSSTEDITVTRIKNGLMLSCEQNKDVIILRKGVETNKEQPNCKHIRIEGASCSKNNKCTYPNCN